ncbi:MAG: PTS sugar transporter subunit IIA [Dokdonella sp.]
MRYFAFRYAESCAVPFLDLLPPEHVCARLVVEGKLQLLDHVARMLARDADEQEAIAAALIQREKLGSTGLGHGVAIPHARMEGISEVRAALIQLAEPIAFDAIDGQPVDLIAAMVVPEHSPEQHLHLLAELAELFSSTELTTAMRRASDGSALREELAEFVRNKTKSPTWID